VDLFASENPIEAFPPVIAKCGRLEKLSLAACCLKGQLPADVGRLTALRCGGGQNAPYSGH
jgi:hypothetical protein